MSPTMWAPLFITVILLAFTMKLTVYFISVKPPTSAALKTPCYAINWLW